MSFQQKKGLRDIPTSVNHQSFNNFDTYWRVHMTNMSFLVKLFAIKLYAVILRPILAWDFAVDVSPKTQGLNFRYQTDTIQ
jgi:hypothetical protein